VNSKDWRGLIALILPYLFKFFRKKKEPKHEIEDLNKKPIAGTQTSADELRMSQSNGASSRGQLRHKEHRVANISETDSWDYR
jgi:hypothetical protein